MRFIVLPALCLLSLFSSFAADAHVSVIPKQAQPGSYEKFVFRISHGCKGSPTKAVRLQIPTGVLSVKPQVKPNWKIEIKKETLKEPLKDSHGNLITQVISEIAWIDGSLADEYMDEFSVSVKIPAKSPDTLFFPVIQDCEKGSHKWIQIPKGKEKSDDLDEPAPSVQIQAIK